MGLDGGPAGEVYVELRLSPARMAVGDPTISPARFTGPWVAHRFEGEPCNGFASTYVLAVGDECDPGEGRDEGESVAFPAPAR